MSNEKSLFERSEFMIFQTNRVFLSVEKFELESFVHFFKSGILFLKILKKWLNDGHGAYTYYSALLAKDIDGLLRKYENTKDKTAREKIQEDIEKKYIENQERLIELFTRGPALMNDSKGLLSGLGEYNRVENERAYREVKYQGKNLPQNYITNSLNESIREGKLGVMDINEYIESLRNGAGLR